MIKRNKSPYVLMIVILLGAFVLFSVWAARQAATRGSKISDAAYYSKGLKYTNTQVEKQAAASQGWTLDTRVEQHRMIFRLHDRDGRPITTAQGELTIFLSANNKLLHLETREQSPGFYTIDLPNNFNGSHQARIDFVRQGARISRQLLVNI